MEEYTKYEKARILGARSLQISMGAPILTKVKESISDLEVAEKEFKEGVIPITVKRDNDGKNKD